MGNITTSPSTLVEITKGSGGGKRILTGNLSEGAIVVVGATAILYPYIDDPYIDITNTNWYDWTGPDFMDFSLTLQGSVNIAEMILYSDKDDSPIVGGTFSGSMTVPEPATFFILAFGSVLFWRKEKMA